MTSLQGLELARLQLGADYRVSRDVSITSSYTEIQDKKVNFTGFAGLSGRFDLGGKRSGVVGVPANTVVWDSSRTAGIPAVRGDPRG